MAVDSSIETSLPTQKTEVSVADKSASRWDFLKKIPLFNGGPKKVDGPIPDVTPATQEQLSNPKVSLPAEQADINQQTLESAKKVA
jgi:hypothetical protein